MTHVFLWSICEWTSAGQAHLAMMICRNKNQRTHWLSRTAIAHPYVTELVALAFTCATDIFYSVLPLSGSAEALLFDRFCLAVLLQHMLMQWSTRSRQLLEIPEFNGTFDLWITQNHPSAHLRILKKWCKNESLFYKPAAAEVHIWRGYWYHSKAF